MRIRLGAVAAAGAAVLALAGLVGGSAVTSAGATSTQIATYTATITVPAPPASNFAGSAGGDGWAVAMTPTAVYNVFHHSGTLQVACHLQTDASACWSPVTITDGSGNNFATSGQPGVTIDQSADKLYVFGTRTSDNTTGVVCVDLSQSPAAFCGYTPLTAAGDSGTLSGVGAASDPVLFGSDWYALNAVDGTPTGTKDQLMCFDVAAGAACASQPFAVDFGPSPNVTDQGFPQPSIALFGDEIIIPIALSSGMEMACFNPTVAGNSCGGSWPVSTTGIGYPSNTNSVSGGAPFAMLSSNGAFSGLCAPTTNDPCFDLTGASVTTPSGLAAVVVPNANWDGPSLTIGPRVYVPQGSFSGSQGVACFDYSQDASCTNFPHALPGISDLEYTVNPDPQRPSCIWVNSNAGADQIQNFDAYTGGACGTGAGRVLVSSVVPPTTLCTPSSYSSLQVTTPAPGSYTSGTVQVEDGDGNPIPSIPTLTLDNTGSVNLTPYNLSTNTGLPQFLVSFTGAPSLTQIVLKLTWTGTYDPSCIGPTTSATVASAPGHNAIGYRLQGHDGGVFDFGQSLFLGSLPQGQIHGLVGDPIEATANTFDNGGYWLAGSDGGVFTYGDAPFKGSLAGTHLNAGIDGIAGTPDMGGYWLAGADGGVFTFGDARFHGSLVGTHLNAPIVGIVASADGGGYLLVGADGGVFALGDAPFYGSLGAQKLNAPIVGMAMTPSGKGYWLVAADGGVFSFGDAQFYGSLAGKTLNEPIVAMVAMPDGSGYWLIGGDGGVFALGNAPFLGSAVNYHLNQTITSASS
ncbi:MAG TPA: hypothetical protein VND70_03785 [Acidimicrobiales bacterium]|nr:hypothetical protein [Acidimicrobiales bacterium]